MTREVQLFRGQPVDRTDKNICYRIAGEMLTKRSGLVALGLLSTSTKLISALMDCRFKEVVIPEENEEIYQAIKADSFWNLKLAPSLSIINTSLQSMDYRIGRVSGGRPPDEGLLITQINERLKGRVDFIDIDTCYMWSNEHVWGRFPKLIAHYASSGAVVHINGIQDAQRRKAWCISDEDCIETIDNLIAKIPRKVTAKKLHKYKAKGRNGNLVTMRAACLRIE